jgi:hypothetical protein
MSSASLRTLRTGMNFVEELSHGSRQMKSTLGNRVHKFIGAFRKNIMLMAETVDPKKADEAKQKVKDYVQENMPKFHQKAEEVSDKKAQLTGDIEKIVEKQKKQL